MQHAKADVAASADPPLLLKLFADGGLFLFYTLCSAALSVVRLPLSLVTRSFSSSPAGEPTPPTTPRASRSSSSDPTSPWSPDADADDGGPHAWWRSPLATPAEADTVAAAAALLADLVPEMLERHPQLLEPSGPLLEIQLLRHLRALGPSGTAKQTARGWRNAWEWKKANRVHDLVNGLEREERRWLAARDLPHGAWATRHLRLGMRCGRARGGHPVKVERMGAYDTAAILREDNAEERLREYYYGLLEDQERALDAESVAAGRLLRSFEVFDLLGASTTQVTFATFRFAQAVVVAFSQHYPETTARAVLLNVPPLMRRFVNLMNAVLPERVRGRVALLGADYHDVLAAELDATALELVAADHDTLAQYRSPRWLPAEARSPARRLSGEGRREFS